MNVDAVLNLLHQEVVPALGCTEPVAVALAAARATEALGCEPELLEVEVSANLLKNGMGVIVPGTGQAGLEIAAACGALGGKSANGLECLKELSEEEINLARDMVKKNKIRISVPDNNILLYCKVTAQGNHNKAAAELRDAHANLTRVWINNDLIYEKELDTAQENIDGNKTGMQENEWPLSVADIYNFALKTPLETISFILQSAQMNRQVAEEGLQKAYGLAVGKNIDANVRKQILADDMQTFAVKLTAAAADARMAGVMLPVMSNSGSGNQGITCTMPVVACAMRLNKSDEELARALILSHLTAIHIKHHLGRLSAHCGAMVAATASACGITWLLGGGLKEIEMTIRNMVGNVAGMICDGAKSSCALKVASAVSAGIQAAMLALDGIAVPGNEGIVANNIEECIANLGRLGSTGMKETDKVILDIMLHKNC